MVDDVQFKLKIPADLKAALQASADANGRSLSGEMLIRLRASLETDSETEDAISELFKTVESLQTQIWDIQARTGIADPYNSED